MQFHGAKKYTYNNVPPDVREAFDDAIEEQGLECVDNDRFTPVDDAEGMEQYDDIATSGCCGKYDGETTDSTGRLWFIGCNFGH